MTVEKIDTLVVGGGQAGIAMSEHLSNAGIAHLVLERHRIAERWRTQRWDSLVANGPAWHDRFPNMAFNHLDPDAFASKQSVAEYFVKYAAKINAPIRSGVEVLEVLRCRSKPGFSIETSEGRIEANHLVVATGPFQNPMLPNLIPQNSGYKQIHSSEYRNPEQLPKGNVLVVGAGSSGAQIAEELLLSGKGVHLSIGPHDRPPRRYRGRDFVWWLGVLGKWDLAAQDPDKEHQTIAVSGARGGHTVDFRRFAAKGITLVGRTLGFESGQLKIAQDLAQNLAAGDQNTRSVLDEADQYVERNGLDFELDLAARQVEPDPPCVTSPLAELDIQKAGITTVIWATGYSADYSWLKVNALDQHGKPRHHRGISTEPGVYFLGLPWLSNRGSSFIWGVWHDAKYLADQIVTQRQYQAYRNPPPKNQPINDD